MNMLCPLCNSESCFTQSECSSNRFVFICRKNSVIIKMTNSVAEPENPDKLFMYKNLIYEHYMTEKDNYQICTYHLGECSETDSQCVDLSRLHYPKSFDERLTRSLLNLSRNYPKYGQQFKQIKEMPRILFCEDDSENTARDFLRMMCDIGTLIMPNSDQHTYHIAPEGWRRLDEYQHKAELSKRAFIAMSFSEEMADIRNAIKKGIECAGYTPIIMDEVEYNGQVVPEMLHEIRQCRFLVMDASKRNLGAYYEAGYACGVGIDVIICCKKDYIKQEVHFDIAQQSIVCWETEEELADRLAKRICATIQ